MIASDISRDADTAVLTTSSFREEGERIMRRVQYLLDIALGDSFPRSDPISSMRTD